MRDVQLVLLLVVFAVLVATFAERIRAPAPSVLALAGVGIGLLPGVPAIALDPAAVSLAFLPPLLYAASTDLAMSELRTVLRQVILLAVGLVGATAAAVALVLHVLVPGVPVVVAFVLGAVLASTDPVAVTALARRLDLPPRLLALVQGESLLNDATSLVLFQVAVGVAAAGGRVNVPAAAGEFVVLAGGGAAVGLGLALTVDVLRRRISDPVLETVIALVIPYAAYVAAQSVQASGVTAVVVAGLWLGARDVQLTHGPSRLRTAAVYGVLVFLLESVIFAVIGLQLPDLLRGLTPTDRGVVLPAVMTVTAAVVLSRIAWIYPATYLPLVTRRLLHRRRIRRAPASPPSLRKPPTSLPWQVPAVVSWAGTRGVVPLAAALSIPLFTASGAPFPRRSLLLVLASACIVITLVVQGFTLEPLVRRLGVTTDPGATQQAELQARRQLAQAALARLQDLQDLDAVSDFHAQQLRPLLQKEARRAQARLDELHASGPQHHRRDGNRGQDADGQALRRLRHDLLAVQAERLLQLRQEGAIDEALRRQLQGGLDREETALVEE